MYIVLTTMPNQREAETLARQIVAEKLAACVQVLLPITSFYFWESTIQKESEYLLLIKTLPEKYDELEKFIQTNHSFDTPEIVALSSEKVSQKYLDWMEKYLLQIK